MMSARVLVVDDDPGVSSLLERVLTKEGYDVAVAADAASALAGVASHNPDVILMDVVFPGADGFTLSSVHTSGRDRRRRPCSSCANTSHAAGEMP